MVRARLADAKIPKVLPRLLPAVQTLRPSLMPDVHMLLPVCCRSRPEASCSAQEASSMLVRRASEGRRSPLQKAPVQTSLRRTRRIALGLWANTLEHRKLLCHSFWGELCHRDTLAKLLEEELLTGAAAKAEELLRAGQWRQHVPVEEAEPLHEPRQEPRGAGWVGKSPPLDVTSGPAERQLHGSRVMFVMAFAPTPHDAS